MVYKKQFIAFGTYNALSEGIDESIAEYRYQNSYRPFLSALYRFPGVCASVHYSGNLFSWLERTHPEFNMLLDEMIGRKQVEVIGGAFNSPLLPLIPYQDRLGQIELFTTTIRKRFGRKPRGCWIPAYAWEPGLVSALQTCGMDFAFMPREAFDGFPSSAPAVTEDQGKTVCVFPVIDPSEEGRPADPLAEFLDHFDRYSPGSDMDRNAPVYMFSGERMADSWRIAGAETPDLYYEEVFATIEKNRHAIETSTPGKLLKAAKRLERTYVPSWISREVRAADGREEATPASCNARSVLGRNPTSMLLYSRVHHANLQVGRLKGDKSRKKTAQEAIWKAQGGSAYLAEESCRPYGVVYSAYCSLLEAERMSRQKSGFSPGTIVADLDFDGEKEYLVQGRDMNVFVRSNGGCVYEIDSLQIKRPVCLEDRSSPFHQSFQDRLYPPETDIGAIIDGTASDCAGLYQLPYAVKAGENRDVSILLGREGYFHPDGKKTAIAVEKELTVRHGKVIARSTIRNRSSDALAARWCVPFRLSLDSRVRHLVFLRDGEPVPVSGPVECESRFEVRDTRAGFAIRATCGCRFRAIPALVSPGLPEPILSCDARVATGLSIFPYAAVELQPEAEYSFETEIVVETIATEDAP